MLLAEKYSRHNYHNEKVAKWILDNFDGQIELVRPGESFCSCEDTEYDRTERIDSEYIIDAIPNLTTEEVNELIDIEQVWVYYCPRCLEWAMDGLNI